MSTVVKPQTLRIVSRKSKLALWQANFVKQQLEALHPQLHTTIIGITTQADSHAMPLITLGGKGWFVKELEEALLKNEADLAVHSMKDVPVHLPPGLDIPVILKRENPLDALISKHYHSLSALPRGAIVGTSSLRRQAQIAALRPDLSFTPLRGNVDTRLEKLDSGVFDAIVLAVAGLKRLRLEDRISEIFSKDMLLPAIGQGALGLECRHQDEKTRSLIAPLNDFITALCVRAERAMNKLLGGSCKTPVAGYCEIASNTISSNSNQTLDLQGRIVSIDGKQILQARHTGSLSAPEALGETVAKDLVAQGALDIIESCEALFS